MSSKSTRALLLSVALLLLLRPHSAFHHYGNTSDNPEGSVCIQADFYYQTCASDLACVLDKIPTRDNNYHSRGRCRKIQSTPPPCAIWRCTSRGQDTICTDPKSKGRMNLTCGGWANGPEAPDCSRLKCDDKCWKVQPRGSDGKRYCNLCGMRKKACESKFQVFGPVWKNSCRPAAPDDRRRCCREKGLECLGLRDDCKPDGSDIGCGKGLACVQEQWDEPDATPPRKEAGHCLVKATIPDCSVDYCVKNGGEGGEAPCKLPGSTRLGTCRLWATRPDGGPKPDCSFECPGGCLPRKERPVASNFYYYCSPCILKKVSCNGKFSLRPLEDWKGPTYGYARQGCPDGKYC